MKKSMIKMICSIMLIPLLCACSNTTENANNGESIIEETSVAEKNFISNAENIADALMKFEILMNNTEAPEEKQKIESDIKQYFLEHLNGYYFYLKPDSANMHVDSDNRAISIYSNDEVYIVPFSEKELTDMNLNLEDISQIENSDFYKYHLVEFTLPTKGSDALGEYTLINATFKSDFIDEEEVTSLNSMTISVYLRNENEPVAYQFYGYFSDEQEVVLNGNKKWGAVRDYCRNEDEAYALKAKDDAEWEKALESLEPKEPALGMTKSEIENSTWGEPDKKNIDEYEWGIEEQWVYNRGYIYFEDGIVTGIQHR